MTQTELNKQLINKVKYRNNTKKLTKLLDAGADVNAENPIGETALMIAVQCGNTEAVKLLLDAGADPNIQDELGLTALIKAAQGRTTEAVKLLLDRGADPNIKNIENDTALQRAILVDNMETIKLLIEHEANPNIQRINSGWTALMLAAVRGRTEIMEMFIQAGADPDIKNDEGETAMDILKDWHPEKYDQWRQSTLVKARKKTLKCEDSVNSGRNVPDFDI